MKVVVDVRYVRKKPAGIGSYVRAIATRMPPLAPDIDFRFWANAAYLSAFGRHPNLEVIPVSGDPLGPVTVLAPSRLASLEGVDVYHSPQNVLGRGIRAKTVVTVHDLMWLTDPRLAERNVVLRSLGWPLFAGGAYYALKHADRLIAVSQATADAMTRFDRALASRTHVVHNAADPSFAPYADEGIARSQVLRILGSDAPYFLVLGASQPYKDHESAMHAFARAARGHERLVLVQRRGAGGPLAVLAENLGIAARVQFCEALDRDAIVLLLQCATALIHPSRLEGFGLPVLEAMAAGCPVVATDIPALAEVLGGAGSMSAPGDIQGLAQSMRKFADDPALRAEKREHGLARAKDFDWERATMQTVEVYREAALVSPLRHPATP